MRIIEAVQVKDLEPPERAAKGDGLRCRIWSRPLSCGGLTLCFLADLATPPEPRRLAPFANLPPLGLALSKSGKERRLVTIYHHIDLR